jgi:hypothetical protein
MPENKMKPTAQSVKGCLYIKKLEEVQTPTLKKLIGLGVKEIRKNDQPQKPA